MNNPITAPLTMRLYDLARLAQATGNMLVVEQWRLCVTADKQLLDVVRLK